MKNLSKSEIEKKIKSLTDLMAVDGLAPDAYDDAKAKKQQLEEQLKTAEEKPVKKETRGRKKKAH